MDSLEVCEHGEHSHSLLVHPSVFRTRAVAHTMERLLRMPVSSWHPLPWDQHKDYRPEPALQELKDLRGRLLHLDSQPHQHHLDQTVEFLFHSNKTEGIEHEYGATQQMLQEAMKQDGGMITKRNLNETRKATKDEDHRRNVCFVVQHYKALCAVKRMVVSDFTVDAINVIHHTLLEGLEDVDAETNVAPGRIRTEGCCATGINNCAVQYLDPANIHGRYGELVTLVRTRMKTTVQQQDLAGGLALAGLFLVKFLEIHPYGDGNGRMARLLVHVILRLHGITNPLILVQGRFRKAHRHYLQMLNAIQQRGKDPTMAFTFILSHALDDAREEVRILDDAHLD